MDFHTWLETLIELEGLSVKAAAERAGVGVSTLHEIINKKTRPSDETCRKLARAFNTPELHVLRLAGYVTEDTEMSPEEGALLSLFRKLKPEEKNIVLAMIRGLKSK